MANHSGPNYFAKGSNVRQARWAISCLKQNLVLGAAPLFHAAGKGTGFGKGPRLDVGCNLLQLCI